MSNSYQQSASLSSLSPPPSGYATPVACQHCGAAAHLIDLMPHPKQLNAELRIFECADCGKQTELIVTGLNGVPLFNNGLLDSLAGSQPERLRNRLRPLNYVQGDVLAESDASIEQAIFPRSGLISIVTDLSDGERIEAAMVQQFSVRHSISARRSLSFPVARGSSLSRT